MNKDVIKNISAKDRVFILISALWGFFAFGEAYRYDGLNISELIFTGLMPIVFFWGIYWVIKGYMKEQAVEYKKCPYCAEKIKTDASICRFCGEKLHTEQTMPTESGENI